MMMSLQNREIVAHEGRYDLPFLFCMFGRHGPAVALLIALLLFMMGLFSISRKVLALIRYLRRKAHRKHMKKDAVMETTESPKSDMQVPRVFYRIGDTLPEKMAGYIPNRSIKVFSQKQHNEDARDHSTVDSIDLVPCKTDSSDVHSTVASARATDTLHQQPQVNEIHVTDNSSFDMEPDEGPTVERTNGLLVGNVEVCFDNVETQAEEKGEDCKKREIDRGATMENIQHNKSLPWTDISVLSCSQNQSSSEQHPSQEHHQDCFITSDIIGRSEEVPEAPEDDVDLDQNTVESADVVLCKTDSSEVYSTVASDMNTDTLHQQPWINEEILITDNNKFDEDPTKESTVECKTVLSEGNVEELCLDNVETQAEEMGESGKKIELDMEETMENLSGLVCVESQSHPETLAPTEPYDECFITKAAEHPDTNTHTAEVTDKKPNEDDFINVHNTVESADVVEYKTDPSDVGSTLAFAMDTDSPALLSGHLPQTVDQREEVVSASDHSGPGLGFEDSRDPSIACTSGGSATQSLTGSPVPPGLSQEDSGPAGSNVIPGSDSVHQHLNTTETQNSQLGYISEAIRNGTGIVTSHSAPVNQQPPIREEIHITDNINIDEEPDEEPTVELTTGLPVGTQAEEIGEGCKRRETVRVVTMENSGHITDGNNQGLPWTDISVLSCSQNQSSPEQHPSQEHHRDCFIASDIIDRSEEVPEGPEDDVRRDLKTVESTDVVEYKTNSSDVYITVASAIDKDTLHQQPKINEEIPITDNNNFVEEPTVECTTVLSEGNVEELCLDNIETQAEEMGECGKKIELDMEETMENLSGRVCVESQSHPGTLAPTEPYDECFITKAAEHPDTNTHTAEVTDKKPNEDDFINVHNTVESTDAVEYKTDPSDVGSTLAFAMDTDSPALLSGHLPQTVDQREEVVSASDHSGPGLGFEDSRDPSIACTSGGSATQSLTGSPVPPGLSQEDSGPAGSNVIPGSDSVHQHSNTTETQKSQLGDISEAIRYGTGIVKSHSAAVNQQPPIREEIHITDNTNIDEEPDEVPTVELTTGLSVGNFEEVCLDKVDTQAEEMGEGCKKKEMDRGVTMENIQHNKSIPWTDISVLSCSQNQSSPEQHSSKEHHQDCFITSDIIGRSEEVPEGPEDDVGLDQNTVESADVVVCKTDSSEVYSTVASDMNTDTLHQQPWINEEILITDNTHFDEEPDKESTVECKTVLSVGNVEELCLDNFETQAEEMGESGKKIELDMEEIMENLSGPLCVESQSHPETLAPTEPYDECFITKAAEHPDTNTHTAEVTDKKPNEDDFINVHNTVESTDAVEYKTDPSDVGSTLAFAMDTDSPALLSGHLPQTVDQREEVVSASDHSGPGLGFEDSRDPSIACTSGGSATQSLTGSPVPPGLSQEDSGPAGSNVIPDSDSVHQHLNTTETQKSQLGYISEAIRNGTGIVTSHSAPVNQQPPIREEIHITDNTNVDEEPDEDPTVELTTGLSDGNVEELCLDNIETKAEEMGEDGENIELDMEEIMENLSGLVCVESQSHPETLAPTEPYDECFITKAAEHPDTNTHTAEVTDKKPNEDDFINVHNTVESADVVEHKSDSSDANSAVAPAIDKVHQQPQVNEEIQVTDKIEFDEEPDEGQTITTDTTTPSNRATETSQTFENDNPDTMGSVIVPKVPVSFGVQYFTHSSGQNLAVTGNHQDMGSWTGFLPLEEKEDGYWSRTMHLPSMIQVEWKFVVVDEAGEVARWEECDNRWFETRSDAHSCIQLHKHWGTQ